MGGQVSDFAGGSVRFQMGASLNNCIVILNAWRYISAFWAQNCLTQQAGYVSKHPLRPSPSFHETPNFSIPSCFERASTSHNSCSHPPGKRQVKQCSNKSNPSMFVVPVSSATIQIRSDEGCETVKFARTTSHKSTSSPWLAKSSQRITVAHLFSANGYPRFPEVRHSDISPPLPYCGSRATLKQPLESLIKHVYQPPAISRYTSFTTLVRQIKPGMVGYCCNAGFPSTRLSDAIKMACCIFPPRFERYFGRRYCFFCSSLLLFFFPSIFHSGWYAISLIFSKCTSFLV